MLRIASGISDVRVISKASGLICCLSLLACTSNSLKDDVQQERFKTEILADGSKRFIYGVAFDEIKPSRAHRDLTLQVIETPQRNGSNKQPASMMRPTSNDKTKENMLNALYAMLAQKLASTGYCREGYFELDQYISQRRAQIKAECNESANEQDKQRFINQ